ncbi:MAG: TonB-dependent receptor [Caulobacterales bacterium]|nr:TonB-dependent receptor [Caulobacterales bacterium]MCA0372890.1 TonB-dependent receptor [Pseudomonadota bacterium]
MYNQSKKTRLNARKIYVNSFVSILALCASGAIAQETQKQEDAKKSETVFVVGQRNSPITVVPRGLSVSLNRADFEAVNAINVEDLMKYAPNFYVRKRFAGDDNAVVALRGANTTQSARVIVMVDGFLVSNFLGNTFSTSPKWNVVGPNEVKQFDIVYGPYSARYGGNSMGGIVSVTTEVPKENSGFISAQYTSHSYKEYGVDETFTGYNIEGGANWKQKNGPLSARFSFRHFDSIGQPMSYSLLTPTTGSGTIVTGAYVDNRLANPVFGGASYGDVLQDQIRGRIGVELGGDWAFDILAMGWRTEQRQENPYPFLKDASGNIVGQGKVTFNGKTYNATGLGISNFNRDEFLVGAKLSGTINGWKTSTNLSKYSIPVWETHSAGDYLKGKTDGAGTYTETDNPSWWALDSGAVKTFGNHKIAFGVNGNLYETYSDTYNVTNWRTAAGQSFSAASGGKTRTLGVYIEDEINLKDKATLTLGARYESWKAFDGSISKQSGTNKITDFYPERTNHSFNPKASIQGEIADGWLAQLSLGSATRFPTVGELFQAKIDDVTKEIDPQSFDPNLRPEVSTDISFLMRHSFGPVRLTSSVFYQDIKDAIVSFQGLNQYGNVVSSYKNIDLTTQYGIEVIADAKNIFNSGLDAELSVSRMEARTIRNTANPSAEGVMLPRIPAWRANGNFRYKFAPNLKGSLGWRYASRPNSDLFGLVRGDAYGFQSEYFYVDARIVWDVNKHIKWGFGVDNINNDHGYVSHPMPQRTFVTDIKYTF